MSKQRSRRAPLSPPLAAAPRALALLTPLLVAAALTGCGGSNAKVAAPAGSPEPARASSDVSPHGAAPAPGTEASPAPPETGQLRMNASAQASYQRGVTAYAGGDLAAAKSAFQEAISSDPRAYQAQYSLGVVLERLGDPAAQNAYRQAFTLEPSYEPAIAAYALYLGTKRGLAEADTFLQGKQSQLPGSAGVIAALAEIKSMQRDTAAAQRLAQEALKKNADYRPAMLTIARDHYRNRRLDLSLYALQAILDGFGDDNPPRDRGNPDAHWLRGMILKEEGRRAAAIEELKQAVSGRPDLVAARVELAAFYLEAGNAADAQPLLEGALRFDPNHVQAHLNLGDAYRLAGRIPDAKTQFDWVVSRDTSLAQVHYDLALLYLFAPSVPGMDPRRQADQAIAEITKYQQMRGKLAAGQSDDSDELLNRARQKQADLQAQQSAKEPVGPPAASPAPAGSGTKPAVPAPPPRAKGGSR